MRALLKSATQKRKGNVIRPCARRQPILIEGQLVPEELGSFGEYRNYQEHRDID
jgi:hypothetical protein